MNDRQVLDDGIGAVRIDRHRHLGNAALLDQHDARAARHIGQAGRRTGQLDREGQHAVAARTRQGSTDIDGIGIIAGAAEVTPEQGIVVELNVDVAAKRELVLDADRQGRGDRVAVAIGQRVGEDVTDAASRTGAQIAVIAVGVDRQRAMHTNHHEVAGSVCHHIEIAIGAGDPRDAGPIGAWRIGGTVSGVGIATEDVDAGDDVTGSGAIAADDRVGIGSGIHRRTIVKEGNLARHVDRRRGERVAVAVGCGDRHADRVGAKLQRLILVGIERVIERQILLDRHDARRRVDRDGERRLTAKRPRALDHTDNIATGELHQVDRGAVGQRDPRRCVDDAERIADAIAGCRAICAEGRVGIDDRRDRGGLPKGKPARQVGIVALDDYAGVDAIRVGRQTLVDRRRRIGINRRSGGRTVVEEADLVGDVDRARRDGVAVAVGCRNRRTEATRSKCERIVRIGIDRVIERQILLDRDHAGAGVDRDRECCLSGQRTRRDHANHHAIGELDEVNRGAVGQGQARTGIEHGQGVAQRTAGLWPIGAEQGVGVEHRACRAARTNCQTT